MRGLIFAVALMLSACGGAGDSTVIIVDGNDPGSSDNGNPDTGNPPGGGSDNGNPDTNNPPGGGSDNGNPDSGNPPATHFSISGSVSAAVGVVLDDDVNDIFATHCSYSRAPSAPSCNNDDINSPQLLPANATVMGFASAAGTNKKEASLQRYFSTTDKADYYRISLKLGDLVTINVADAATGADLDLYATMYQGNTLVSSPVYSSINRGYMGVLELFSVAMDGDYLIKIDAYSGVSKYVLQIHSLFNTAVAAPADFVAGEVIAQYDNAYQAASTTQAYTGPNLMQIPAPNEVMTLSAAFNGISNLDGTAEFLHKVHTLKEIKRLQERSDVLFAEPNYVRQALAVPNDPSYSQQWHYPAMNLPLAWDITTGTPDNGSVVVAVVDTGVFLTHPDLAPNLVAGYDFISDANRAGDGNGIDNNPDDVGDGNMPGTHSWHGTHVAGTIAAASNNGVGVAGVSWGAKIMPIRVLGKGGGTSYDLAQGIRYAAGLTNDSGHLPTKRADIINLSLGSSGQSDAERNAIAEAIAAGVLVVAAAGNDNVSTKFYPAAYPKVIAVSSTRFDGAKASYSNYGSHIQVAAPGGEMSLDQNGDYKGDGVYSTYVNDASGQRTASYEWLQGTSMAAPHVAGVVALMKAVNPALTQDDVLALLSSCEITSKKGQCSHDNQLGYGQIDAFLAVFNASNSSPVLRAVLAPSESMVVLHAEHAPNANITLSNHGSAAATAITLSSSANWISVPTTLNDIAAGSTANLAISVGAAAASLTNGRHSAALTISYHTGVETKTLSINVTLIIGNTNTSSTLTQHYLILEKADCINGQQCQYQEEVIGSDGASSASFVFNNIPAGNYRLYAGTDIDVDYAICQSGETCGVYPSGGQVLVLNRNISSADIVVKLNGLVEVIVMGLTRSASSTDVRRSVAR